LFQKRGSAGTSRAAVLFAQTLGERRTSQSTSQVSAPGMPPSDCIDGRWFRDQTLANAYKREKLWA